MIPHEADSGEEMGSGNAPYLTEARRRYLVTRVETVKVEARTEEDALFMGEQKLDFVGAETTNIEVEELEES